MMRAFSSPLSGTFFNNGILKRFVGLTPSFRPLSRGLFSIKVTAGKPVKVGKFSSPLSGTFFNWNLWAPPLLFRNEVFVPSLGDFFQYVVHDCYKMQLVKVFVPSLGDFFQLLKNRVLWEISNGFRPLSRGLFSICLGRTLSSGLKCRFSSPLSGTFFNR